MAKIITYKVVELSRVTDEDIEDVLNKWTAEGWQYERINFVTQDGSRRPVMAFLFFVQHVEEGAAQ